MDYQNAEGSTGKLKDGAFVAFKSQSEADASLKPQAPDGPFASLPEPVQKSLADAGITTVEQATALGKEGLMKLKNIGEATADDILAL